MATAVHDFNRLQLGIEVVSTKGTLVPATVVVRADVTLIEEQDTYHSAYPQGVRATAGGAGTILRKGVTGTVETELTPEEILWPLHTGVRGSITPTGGGASKTWAITPQLTTSVITVQSATVEYMRSDGTTNHYYGESGYALTSGFKITWAYNQIAKLQWSFFGRARQTDTPTAALSEYSTREPLVSNLLAVYLDTAGASIGNTQVASIVRNVEFECMTGLAPNYTMDARSDLDQVNHKVSMIGAKLKLQLELNATAATYFGYFRSNSLCFIRLKNTGSAISGGGNETVQIDGAYRFTKAPDFSVDGDQVLMTAELEAVYDTTWAKILDFSIINQLASI